MTADHLSKFSLVRHLAAFAAISILATGCGDGEDTVQNAAPTPSTGSGSGSGGGSGGSGGGITLEINGQPPGQIVAGTPFDYTPTVSNPDNVPLTFSATNLPGWATINPSSGRVTGTPGPGDVGTYSGIRITVSGGGESDSTPFFSVQVVAIGLGSATLSWVPPTQQTDGSPLTDLAGFRIYYGQSQGNLNLTVTIANPGLTSYVVEDLTPATWYFAATAYDRDGMESGFSNMASKTIM